MKPLVSSATGQGYCRDSLLQLKIRLEERVPMVSIMNVAAVVAKMNEAVEENGVTTMKKNQVYQKPMAVKYVRVEAFKRVGTIPAQQSALAAILDAQMVVGEEYTEEQVFEFLMNGRGAYHALAASKQSVTYLLRYYRGLRSDGKRAGFIARGYLRVL